MSIYSMLKAALRTQGWMLARVPEEDELHAAELVDLLTEDNADGRARHFAVAFWLTYMRDVSKTCVLTVAGPLHRKKGLGFVIQM